MTRDSITHPEKVEKLNNQSIIISEVLHAKLQRNSQSTYGYEYSLLWCNTDIQIKKVLAHYESQPEEEAVAVAVAEDEAAFEVPGQTVIEVSTDLVPAIRELIAKHKKVA